MGNASGVYVKLCTRSDIVKTQRNSTQLKATLKQLALELDTVITWNPPHFTTTQQVFSHL